MPLRPRPPLRRSPSYADRHELSWHRDLSRMAGPTAPTLRALRMPSGPAYAVCADAVRGIDSERYRGQIMSSTTASTARCRCSSSLLYGQDPVMLKTSPSRTGSVRKPGPSVQMMRVSGSSGSFGPGSGRMRVIASSIVATSWRKSAGDTTMFIAPPRPAPTEMAIEPVNRRAHLLDGRAKLQHIGVAAQKQASTRADAAIAELKCRTLRRRREIILTTVDLAGPQVLASPTPHLVSAASAGWANASASASAIRMPPPAAPSGFRARLDLAAQRAGVGQDALGVDSAR